MIEYVRAACLFGGLFAATAVMISCTSVGNEEVDLSTDPRRGQVEDTICFGLRLSGFYEVADNALVIRRSPGDAYLVETGFCPSLKAIEGLRINNGNNCLRRGDRISVFDTNLPLQGTSSDRPDQCLVNAIYHWTEDQDRSGSDR